MGGFNVIPGANSHNPFPGFGGFNNGMSLPSIAAGTQNQPSGGFNTDFSFGGSSGVPGGASGFSDFSSLFSANGTTNLNPATLFGGNAVPGSLNNIPGAQSTTLGPTGLPQIQGSALKNLYGHGVGDALSTFLNSGAGFNPGVVQAEQNAAMPLEARGVASIMNAMGGHGLSGSSTAAVGVGDFESQFNSQLENMFAQQYEQSVQNYLQVLMGVAPGAQQQQADSGFMGYLKQGAAMLSGMIPSAPGYTPN